VKFEVLSRRYAIANSIHICSPMIAAVGLELTWRSEVYGIHCGVWEANMSRHRCKTRGIKRLFVKFECGGNVKCGA
jgi:hypothetical protein